MVLCRHKFTSVMHFEIIQLPEFDECLSNIRDGMTRRRLARCLERVMKGNLGNVKPVGDGVWEMREFFGAGWRMYYVQHGEIIIIMLGGGDKSTQQRDIEHAISLAKRLED